MVVADVTSSYRSDKEVVFSNTAPCDTTVGGVWAPRVAHLRRGGLALRVPFLSDHVNWCGLRTLCNQVVAVRMRAGLDGVNPRDVVIAALDVYLRKEIQETRVRLTGPEFPTAPKVKAGRHRSVTAD